MFFDDSFRAFCKVWNGLLLYVYKGKPFFNTQKSILLAVSLFLLSHGVFAQTIIQGVEEQDYNALVDLYNNTNGAGWSNSTGWLDSGVPVNDWYGVTVTNNRVTNIDLRTNNLDGTLASSFGDLTALEVLRLNQNNLSGTIPAGIGEMANLNTLYLSNNKFSGNLPAGLANLSHLGVVAVDNNNLTSLLYSALDIFAFYVDNNKLTFGDLIYQQGLTGCRYAPQKVVSDNVKKVIEPGGSYTIQGVDGHADSYYIWYKDGDSIAQGSNSSFTVDNFTSADAGKYRYEITNDKFQKLTLKSGIFELSLKEDDGLVQGVPEAEYNALVNLYNSTGGDNWNTKSNWLDPQAMVGSWAGVTVVNNQVTAISLRNNNLTGSLPASLANLSALIEFSVENNQLSGSIPDGFTSLSRLNKFHIQQNFFTSLTSAALSYADDINVSSNKLTFGDLIAQKNISGLKYAPQKVLTDDISEEVLIGVTYTISGADGHADSYYKWYRNDTLLAEGQEKSYTITGFSSADAGAYTYEVTNNNLSDLTLYSGTYTLTVDPNSEGLVPNNVEFAALQELYESTGGADWTANTNWLQGSTAGEMAQWYGISIQDGDVSKIELPSNNLQGPLPESLGELTGLDTLNLYSNSLTSLPERLGNLSNLQVFNIYSNQLTAVPESIGNLTKLHTLRLHSNELSSLPVNIGNLTKLDVLAVHFNQLSSLPESIGKLTNLEILYIEGNQLTSLPASINNLSKLTTIYAKQNRFSSLPSILAELPSFNNLYVHENQLNFEAIEQFFTGANTDVLADFKYAPQNIKDPVSILTEVNRVELLDAQDNASQNSYQWQKKVNDVWEDIAGATASTYETSLAAGEAEAFYRCYITNGWVTDLTLYSPVYHLQEASDLIKNLADNKPTDATPAAPGGIINKPGEVTEAPELNYVRTFTPRVPLTDPATVTITKPAAEVQVSTAYIDGLGRRVQTVIREESPAGKDIISPVVYDEYGRLAKEYLPYTYSSASPGAFQPNALLQQYDFYHASADDVADTDYPFDEKVFEPSPLNRVTKQAAPGGSWAVGTGKEVEFDWRPNSQERDGAIRIWEVDEVGLLPVSSAAYGEGELWVTETSDEDDEKVWEYTDKLGQVVLKKVQLADVPSAPEDYLFTYYVYDDFQRLRFVLQPEGVRQLQESGSWIVSGSLKENYCFAYRYDGRGRMIEKKVPGAAKVEMVYNTRDQLVLSRDGNQREAGEWLFTKYDGLNRPILTGMLQDSLNREEMQVAANADEEVIEARAANNDHLGYTNAAFPVLTLSENTYYLTATYYDDYDFNNDGTADAEYLNAGFSPEPQPYHFNRGRKTGEVIRVLNTNRWIRIVSFYDAQGRLIQTLKRHHLRGQDTQTILYQNSVSNRVEAIKVIHRSSITDQGSLTFTKRFTYDHADRLLSISHQVDEGEEVALLANEYNELGELINKQLHKGPSDAAFHQQLTYSYNIRGWLTGINDAENAADKLFAMNLYYDYGFEQLNYNGNISGVKWKNPLSDEVKAYGYLYDKVNRIKGADYIAGAPGSWSSEADRFDMGSIDYDYNGNINSLSRNGLLSQESNGDKIYGVFDELGYAYEGNRLQKVDDAAFKGEGQGFKDGIQVAEEYFYDASGNMVKDANKEIESISYNHLNLPEKVRFISGDSLEYFYDATGTKLYQAVFKDGSLQKVQDYLGEIHYTDKALAFIQHEEGRVLPKGDSWEYQYHLKDHLGNARLTFTSKPETDEYLATMEGEHALAEESEFLDFKNTRVPVAEPLDHTHLTGEPVGTSPEVVRLNGGRRVYEGPRKSLYLLPGDKVTMSVHVKYLDMTQSELNADVLIAALLGAGGYTIGTENGVSTITNTSTGEQAVLQPGDESKVPQAFLSYAFVDQNYLPVDAGFVQVSTAAAVDPANMNKVHEQLSLQFTAKKAGYLDVSLSLGEEAKDIDVYYDDFTVTHQQGPIVQADDYMPFGLTFNSYVSGHKNKYLFQGKERQEEAGWDDFEARMYDPSLGRFMMVDPLADLAESWTTYHFVKNNPLIRIDPTGLTDFKINKETGEVTRVGDENNDPDRILKTDRDGNVKRKGEGFLGFLVKEENRGKPKVAVGGIEQGFLSDGMNLKTEDNVFGVGGEGQPSVEGFEDFALKLSNYIDKEVAGYYLSNTNETDISNIYLGGYEGNGAQNASSGFNLHRYSPDLVGNVEVRVDFHTHLSRFGDSDRLRPSGTELPGGDMQYKRNQLRNIPTLRFIIITNPETFEY